METKMSFDDEAILIRSNERIDQVRKDLKSV